jgi:hypothetical protein
MCRAPSPAVLPADEDVGRHMDGRGWAESIPYSDRKTISAISSSVSGTGFPFMLLVAFERSTKAGISASLTP